MANAPLKPSQLIIEGFAKNGGKQTTGHLVDYSGAYCSLGGIYVGYGINPEDLEGEAEMRPDIDRQLFNGWSTYLPVEEIEAGGRTVSAWKRNKLHTIPEAIIELNDTYGWTFAQVSTWLHTKLGL